ncbi:MAG TPA: amidohydrolase family protein [Chitinophagaceae bacterium]|nr:amidohydrolase family protein [Chitinophagaceae bacterium]
MNYYTIEDFESVDKYDCHVHLNINEVRFIQQSVSDNFKLITINVDVSSEFPTIEEQQELAIKLSETFPGRISYVSTFSVKNFNDDNWIQETITCLKNSFSKGAIAVKVWKNIGMELKDSDNNFVMIDHPKFDPIFGFLIKNNIPLIGHLGEPKNCWEPIEKMTVQGDVNYFSTHPKYHMYLHPEFPSYEDQINARDRMLEKHPDLQFIGAHLGSLEWSIDELAKRLDKFPNMAVDTAARISHLQYQSKTNWQKVHDFCIKYQDRIIYGTDIIVNGTKDILEMKKDAHDIRLRHWNFFTSDATMRVPKVDGEFKGLKLPGEVVDKIYRKNAERWFQGVLVTK